MATQREQDFVLSRIDSELDDVQMFRSAERYTEAKYCAKYLMTRLDDLELFGGVQDANDLKKALRAYVEQILSLPDSVNVADRSARIQTRKAEPPGPERFPIGAQVRVASLDVLENFKETWKYHHPLQDAQLKLAGLKMCVWEVSYYHGGDVLYTLDGAKEYIWHEKCLVPVET